MTIEKKKKRNHNVKWARPERVVKEVTVRELELGSLVPPSLRP